MTQQDLMLLETARLFSDSTEGLVKNFKHLKDNLELSEKDSEKKYTEEDVRDAIKTFLTSNDMQFQNFDISLSNFMVRLRHFKNKC